MWNGLRRKARPLARVGCLSIGTVYVLVGTLALLALSGVLIEAADEDRLFDLLRGLPGGTLLIWLIVFGLSGYVIWRVAEALADPYDFGHDLRGLATRGAIAVSALAYGLIAFSAARVASGNSASGSRDAAEEAQQQLVARIFEWPAGEWLVGLAGAVAVGTGLLQFVLIARRAYTIELQMARRSPAMRGLIHGLAWYGYAARGVILSVLGYFLLRGAVRHDPEAVGDTDTAFDFIGGGAVGDSAFFAVALGTIAYGIFMYINAWHYRFEKKRHGPSLRPQDGERPEKRPGAARA